MYEGQFRETDDCTVEELEKLEEYIQQIEELGRIQGFWLNPWTWCTT